MSTIVNKKKVLNDSQSTNKIGEGIVELLNAVESAMLFYARQHPMVGNAYWWFAEQLGYKGKNYFYFVFKRREHYKLTTEDVKQVYEITKDEMLKQIWGRYL